MSYPDVTPPRRRPLWFAVLCVALCVPAFVLPLVKGMDAVREALGELFTYFPVYVCASALCAWLSYARRRDVSWILTGVVLLSYLAIYLLYCSYGF